MMYEYRATLRKVVDGDTLRLDVDLGWGVWVRNQSVRLHGVDTPERGQPGWAEATQFVKDWMGNLNAPLTIQTTKDHTGKYGRMLVAVWRGEETHPKHSLNTALLDAGHAVVYPKEESL